MNLSAITGNVLSNLPPSAPTAADVRSTSAYPSTTATPVQTSQAVEQANPAEASRAELEKAVRDVNDFLRPINNAIQFNLDDDTGKTIVKVVDLATKDVIRQFPSEEMLSIARAIDKMKGLLIQQKA